MFDTAGQEELLYLRETAYLDTDVFLIAYDMTDSKSLEVCSAHNEN